MNEDFIKIKMQNIKNSNFNDMIVKSNILIDDILIYISILLEAEYNNKVDTIKILNMLGYLPVSAVDTITHLNFVYNKLKNMDYDITKDLSNKIIIDTINISIKKLLELLQMLKRKKENED